MNVAFQFDGSQDPAKEQMRHDNLVSQLGAFSQAVALHEASQLQIESRDLMTDEALVVDVRVERNQPLPILHAHELDPYRELETHSVFAALGRAVVRPGSADHNGAQRQRGDDRVSAHLKRVGVASIVPSSGSPTTRSSPDRASNPLGCSYT